jgi:hypothetical protein
MFQSALGVGGVCHKARSLTPCNSAKGALHWVLQGAPRNTPCGSTMQSSNRGFYSDNKKGCTGRCGRAATPHRHQHIWQQHELHNAAEQRHARTTRTSKAPSVLHGHTHQQNNSNMPATATTTATHIIVPDSQHPKPSPVLVERA